MIVIAIIGILSAVAVPQYTNMVGKSKFAELITVTAELKTAVTQCIQDTNSLDNCSANLNGVPPNSAISSRYLQSITTVSGVITLDATPELNSYTYVLTPDFDPTKNTTFWTVSGTCRNNGYC